MARRPIDRWAVKLRYRPDLAVAFRAMVRQSAIIVSAINRTFSGARDRLVPLLQKFGENRKVLYWVLRGLRVGLRIGNVYGRVPGQIRLQVVPSGGAEPTTP